MDMMTRHRAMMGAIESPSPTKPYPYSIEAWENVAHTSYFDSSLSNWNEFKLKVKTTATGSNRYLNLINGMSAAANAPYFTIPAGSTAQVKLVNIENPNSMPIEFAVMNGSTSVMSISRFTNAVNKAARKTVSADTPINYLRIMIVRTGIVLNKTFGCEIEFYVDGIRWI